jgi:3-oxoacyl-[acyl-carrier-protein] synthase II
MAASDSAPAAAKQGLAFETDARRRVVVTGLGVISPHGLSVEEFWEGVSNGVSAVGRITLCNADGYPTKIAAEVKDFNPQQWIEGREARRMSRATQFAVAAARQALDESGLDVTDASSEEIGVLLGTGTSAFPEIEQAARVWIARGGMKMNPFFGPMVLPNMAAGQVSIQLGLRGYNSTVVTACAATTQAIGEAAEVIRRGEARAMLAGGTEAAISEFGLAAFCLLRALSQRNDDPTRASRPFDRDRDGFVPGEGAAVFVLERLDHALARGARIYTEIIGYGCSSDAFHIVAPAPDGRGAARAIQRALDSAGLRPADIDYVNAHATATDLNDPIETKAIKKVFGDHAYRVPISANKSMFGHLLAGCGSLEALATIMSLRRGLIPPTINLDTPDPECDLDYVPHVARRADVRVAVKNSFGFGGQNAVMVWRRWDIGDEAGLPDTGR